MIRLMILAFISTYKLILLPECEAQYTDIMKCLFAYHTTFLPEGAVEYT